MQDTKALEYVLIRSLKQLAQEQMTHSYAQKNKVQLDPHHKKPTPLSKNAERT